MDTQGRRSVERRKCYLNGRLIFNGGNSSLSAVVRNESPQGARLDSAGLSILPETFDLLINRGGRETRHRARRVWTGGERIGVAFVA